MNTTRLLGVIADENSTIPDIRELLGQLNAAFGGIANVAQMIADDVRASPNGSAPRLTFWTNFIGSIARYGGNDDLAAMRKDELEAEAKRLMENLDGDSDDSSASDA